MVEGGVEPVFLGFGEGGAEADFVAGGADLEAVDGFVVFGVEEDLADGLDFVAGEGDEAGAGSEVLAVGEFGGGKGDFVLGEFAAESGVEHDEADGPEEGEEGDEDPAGEECGAGLVGTGEGGDEESAADDGGDGEPEDAEEEESAGVSAGGDVPVEGAGGGGGLADAGAGWGGCGVGGLVGGEVGGAVFGDGGGVLAVMACDDAVVLVGQGFCGDTAGGAFERAF